MRTTWCNKQAQPRALLWCTSTIIVNQSEVRDSGHNNSRSTNLCRQLKNLVASWLIITSTMPPPQKIKLLDAAVLMWHYTYDMFLINLYSMQCSKHARRQLRFWRFWACKVVDIFEISFYAHSNYIVQWCIPVDQRWRQLSCWFDRFSQWHVLSWSFWLWFGCVFIWR